jgi:hypothetical protein
MDVSRVGIDTSIRSHVNDHGDHVGAVALHLRGLLVPLSVSVSLSDSFWLSAAEKANAFFHQTHVQSKIRGGLMTRRRTLMAFRRRRWHAPGYLLTSSRHDSVGFGGRGRAKQDCARERVLPRKRNLDAFRAARWARTRLGNVMHAFVDGVVASSGRSDPFRSAPGTRRAST